MVEMIRGIVVRVSAVLPLVAVMFLMAIFRLDTFPVPGTDIEIGFFSMVGVIAVQQPFALWVLATYNKLREKRAKALKKVGLA